MINEIRPIKNEARVVAGLIWPPLEKKLNAFLKYHSLENDESVSSGNNVPVYNDNESDNDSNNNDKKYD